MTSCFSSRSDELGPAGRVHVKLLADVLKRLQHLFRRLVAVDAGKRRVGAQHPAVGRGLEDALHRILVDVAVLPLALAKRRRRAVMLVDPALKFVVGPRQAGRQRADIARPALSRIEVSRQHRRQDKAAEQRPGRGQGQQAAAD